ncbi:hypothetical protein D3C73_1484160 [compost metagenome]
MGVARQRSRRLEADVAANLFADNGHDLVTRRAALQVFLPRLPLHFFRGGILAVPNQVVDFHQSSRVAHFGETRLDVTRIHGIHPFI